VILRLARSRDKSLLLSNDPPSDVGTQVNPLGGICHALRDALNNLHVGAVGHWNARVGALFEEGKSEISGLEINRIFIFRDGSRDACRAAAETAAPQSL